MIGQGTFEMDGLSNNMLAAEFLRGLGCHVDPIDWRTDDMSPSAQRCIHRMWLLCHYDHPVAPFQVFHIELSEPLIPSQAFHPVLDPIYRDTPQGKYLFIFTMRGRRALYLVYPRVSQDRKLHTHFRNRVLRVVSEKVKPVQRAFIDSLRIESRPFSADQLADHFRFVFDELEQSRQASKLGNPYPELYILAQNFKPLSPDEQIQLVRVMRGSPERAQRAREQLILHNLRLVLYISRGYQGHGLDLDDLFQEGVFGLVKAIERFDPRLGFHLSTYAVPWIRQSIQRAIADQSRLIRIPVHSYETLDRVGKVIRLLESDFCREPTNREVALKLDLLSPMDSALGWLSLINSDYKLLSRVERQLGQAAARVSRWRQLNQEYIPLQTALKRKEDTGDNIMENDHIETIEDVIPSDEVSPLTKLIVKELRDEINLILLGLNEREQRIIEQRFGLSDGQSRTLDEVGQQIGLTRERVRQIEAKALRKLRHPQRRRRLKPYLQDAEVPESPVREQSRDVEEQTVEPAESDETEGAEVTSEALLPLEESNPVETDPDDSVSKYQITLKEEWLGLRAYPNNCYTVMHE